MTVLIDALPGPTDGELLGIHQVLHQRIIAPLRDESRICSSRYSITSQSIAPPSKCCKPLRRMGSLRGNAARRGAAKHESAGLVVPPVVTPESLGRLAPNFLVDGCERLIGKLSRLRAPATRLSIRRVLVRAQEGK